MKMNYEEFTEFAADRIKDFLPEDYENATVEITKIKKINGGYDGMIVRLPGENGAAAINLNKMYDKYQAGASLGSVLADMSDIAQTEVPEAAKIAFGSFDEIKDKLYVRVCNRDDNLELLSHVPHHDIEDLSMTYHIKIDASNQQLTSAIINNEAFEKLNVSEKVLHDAALQNTRNKWKVQRIAAAI